MRRALPDLIQRCVSLRDAFGRYLELDPEDVCSAGLFDIRCVRYFEGAECPWHRDDPRSHFVMMILLSEPGEDYQGGELVLHAGIGSPADTDAMPTMLEQGDAIIFCAPRVDHAVRQITAGERAVFVIEFAQPRTHSV